MTAYHLEHAWLGPSPAGNGVAHDVLVRLDVARSSQIQPGPTAAGEARPSPVRQRPVKPAAAGRLKPPAGTTKAR